MRNFLKKRWHRIPVALVSAVLVIALVAGGAFAAILTETPQTITQEITEPSSIAVADINLDSVVAGGSVSKSLRNAVVVNLESDGVGKALRMVCNADPLYTSFDVTITLTSKPAGSSVILAGYGITGGGAISVDLDVAGTYTFDQTIEVTTGSTPGAATSTVTFTLEDSTTPLH